MPNYPSLSELLAANKDTGLADAINSGVAGFQQGRDNANADDKRRNDFHNKLKELGILEDKNKVDREQLDETKKSGAAKRIPANKTGIKSLEDLGDREVDISALNAQTKASTPRFRSQDKGSLADGRLVVFDPGQTQRFVVNKDGSTEIYDQATHGELNPAVKPALPAADVEKNVSLDTLANQTENLDAFKSDKFIGQFDARKQKLAQAVDIPEIGLGADPNAGRFQQAARDIQDTIARLRSGGQITVEEMKGLLELVPNEKMSEVDFNARLAQFKQNLNQLREARKRGFTEAGYRTEKLSNQSQPSTAHPVTPAQPGTKRTKTLKSGVTVEIEE